MINQRTFRSIFSVRIQLSSILTLPHTVGSQNYTELGNVYSIRKEDPEDYSDMSDTSIHHLSCTCELVGDFSPHLFLMSDLNSGHANQLNRILCA